MFRRSAISVTIISALSSFGAHALELGQLFPSSLPGWGVTSLASDLQGLKNPAMNYPYYWAWHLFTDVNRPSHLRKLHGGRTVQWENWASDSETFPTCPDPDDPPSWPGKRSRTKVLHPSKLHTLILGDPTTIDWYTLQDGEPIAVSVSDPQEVRRNRASFDYIVDNGLYYTEGLAAAYAEANAAMPAGGNVERSMAAVLETVDFPIDAIEIKADWIPISNIPKGERKNYYTNWAVADGDESETLQEYALVAMHIMTKDVPTWFWATWMNKDVLGRCDYIGCRDDFGHIPNYTEPHAHDLPNYPYQSGMVTKPLEAMMRAKGLDRVFRNYRLVGIQTNFVDPTGNPTLMSNTITEQDQLQTASCMTCHSRAAVDSTGATLNVLSDTAQERTANGETPEGDAFVTDNGVPDPSWFWTLDDPDGFFTSNSTVELNALQIDFVWGILQANSICNTSCPTSSDKKDRKNLRTTRRGGFRLGNRNRDWAIRDTRLRKGRSMEREISYSKPPTHHVGF